jgi:hypothetical protein
MDEHELIIHNLHLKYKIKKEVLREILKSPFRFTRREIESYDWQNPDEFKNFRFINLGIFHYKPNAPYIKKKLKELEDNKEKN